jgi:hypothetical protein
MGQVSKSMGYTIGLSTYMGKGTLLKASPIDLNSLNEIPKVRSRDWKRSVHAISDLRTINFKNHSVETTINSQENRVIESTSLHRSWVIETRKQPSCRCEYLTGIVAENSA